MSYRVRTDNFEGPFDILLYLVSRQRVDIGSINIAEIADQYLAEISKMSVVDLDVASDFLLVASTLLEIKAASLVPRERDETTEELVELGPTEARDLLVARLLEYKKFKSAAAMLEGREQAQMRLHPRVFGPDQEFLKAMPDFLRDVPLESIAFMAAGAYARREVALLESDHIAAKPIPVEIHVRALHTRIKNKKRVRFSELVGGDTPTPIVVVTFLAVLELYKRSMVNIVQDHAFGDIDISYIEGSGDLVFDDNEDDGLIGAGQGAQAVGAEDTESNVESDAELEALDA